MRAILAGSGFRRLVATRVTSQVADGWFQAGLAGSLLFNPDRQASPVAIAGGFAILLVPYSIVGPFVGVLLDRWQRRTSLFAANVVRAGLVVPAAALLWVGDGGPAFAFLALFVIAANRFFLAGLGAALPHVVDDERLVAANAIATTLGTVFYAAGLGSAAALLSTPLVRTDNHGYAAIAILGAAGYLLSSAVLRTMFTRTALGPDVIRQYPGSLLAALTDVARGMVAGLRHLAQRRAAGYAVLVQAGHRALFGVLFLATLLLFSRHFTAGISGLGIVVAAGGAGALVAAFVTPFATRHLPGWVWVSVLLGGTGCVLLVLAPSFRPGLLVLAVFLLNIASQGTKIVVDTTLQHECDDAYRGRVFSVNDTGYNATLVAGLFAAASLLPADGRSPTGVVLVSLGYGILAIWYAIVGRRWAYRRQLSRVSVTS